jgi:Ca-activated chloride channel family protein
MVLKNKFLKVTLSRIIIILCLFFNTASLSAQYYIRGEIKDEKSNPLQNVRIILQSTGMPYSSGVGGAFGILSAKEKDSLHVSLDGYESVFIPVNAQKYQKISLKMLPFTASLHRHSLLSLTPNLEMKMDRNRVMGDETYNSLIENEFINAEKNPETSVVLNVDRASYSNIRRFINMNSEVPPDAVRIEEMLNYFSINFAEPPSDSLFRVSSNLSSCPWNEKNQLVFLQVNSRKINLDKIPPSNLVFLIDVSGSMDMPNRLPLLKVAFRKLVATLRQVDTVSIVVYGSVVGVMLQPTSGDNKKKILDAIEALEPGGFTPGEAGILQAYRLAKHQYIKGGNNRVILATDGDFNIGHFAEKDLEELITKQKQGGVYLTCLGVGMGNYKDSKIEVLAKKGNGNFAYLDNEQEAEKVLVKELTQTLYTVADDVYMKVNFNPSLVESYRLIGFDNRVAALSDTTNLLEGGEIGSGHAVMAIFEITPTEKNVLAVKEGVMKDGIATVNIHYRLPGKVDARNHSFKCPYNYLDFRESEQHLRFGAAVVLYGSLLRGSEYVKNANWDQLLVMIKENMDESNPFHREFYDLVIKSQKIYVPLRKKKKTDQ